MQVKTIAVGALATNCYILVEGDQCVVIDPGDEGDRILKAVQEDGTGAKGCVKAILLTHAHFDHTLAAGYLQRETEAPVFVGLKDKVMLLDPGWMRQLMPSGSDAPSDVRTLSEGDRVPVGDVEMEVWETPGHSPGSLTFLLPEKVSAAGTDGSLMLAFCGDLIFRRGVGRTDLPGGDPDRLFESVDRVLRLPGKTVIYPGHGPRSNVRSERALNPFLFE